MKTRLHIIGILLLLGSQLLSAQPRQLAFDFFGEAVLVPGLNTPVIEPQQLKKAEGIQSVIQQLSMTDYDPLIKSLLAIKEKEKLDDWLYYQLVRKTASALCPKSADYYLYTLYKWFLLTRSGFDASIRLSEDKMLFYVRTDEKIYNLPAYYKEGRQYICLNYHDYGSNIDFKAEVFRELDLAVPEERKTFSYKITKLPEFRLSSYEEKDIRFNYYQSDFQFTIKLNPAVKTIFANYPVVDYASYFNIPLSQETYRSLIPLLRENVRNMSVKGGVDYLMRFTRYAFMFKPDAESFGTEKRLSPEQTLLYPESDCEDRAALFFYLVKEIYNLPMIVMAYPQHVTIAIKFDKPIGKPIVYNGQRYTVCEPTPQKEDLALGELLPSLAKTGYEVVYAYQPSHE